MSATLVSRRSREARHPKRRVLGQPFGVLGILVARQAAVDRLAEEIHQRELAVVSAAGIGEVPFDQRAQTKAGVQLAREQEAGTGGHCRAPELDAKLRVEREANRARCRVTHSPRAAFRAGAERAWPCPFTSQNENVGSSWKSSNRSLAGAI